MDLSCVVNLISSLERDPEEGAIRWLMDATFESKDPNEKAGWAATAKWHRAVPGGASNWRWHGLTRCGRDWPWKRQATASLPETVPHYMELAAFFGRHPVPGSTLARSGNGRASGVSCYAAFAGDRSG